MTDVIAEIAAERRRQTEAEGWTLEHDDEHENGELALAATAYASVASAQARGASSSDFPADMMISVGEWPWEPEWWKPRDARRNLVRAAALLVAEIERLDRLQPPCEEPGAPCLEEQTCPRRMTGGPWRLPAGPDHWRVESNGDRTCSYCGSLHPDDFARLCEKACDPASGVRIYHADKQYKVYIRQPGVMNASQGGIKFYKMHTPDDEAWEARVGPIFRKALDVENDQLRSALAAQETFQERVAPWLHECFGHMTANDVTERNYRFLEEALELVQACGATHEDCLALVDYVYGRPVGEPEQEVGGVRVTLAALCLAQGIDMHHAGEKELARVWENIDRIRIKNQNKPIQSPLPGPTPPTTLNPGAEDG